MITNQTVGNSQEERYLHKLNWLKENLDHLIDIFYQEEISKLLEDLKYYDVTGQMKVQLPKYIKPENTMAGNFYPKDSFERIQEVFHLTEDEVYSVLDESDFIRFHFVS